MAPLEVIGNGDYALNFGAFDGQGFLEIVIANTSPGDEVCFVWHGFGSNENAAVKVYGDSNSYVGTVGVITDEAPIFKIDKQFFGVVAIIVNGSFMSRCALYGGEYSVDDCFALPLPLYAYREEEAVQPISIVNNVAGWEIYSPYQPTRIVGFNLPTSLEYTASGESVGHEFTADGGNYGIEFTTPNGAAKIAIFNETFWLYLDSRT